MKRMIKDLKKIIEEWNNLSERGRTEFDQVIMTQPTAYNVGKVVSELAKLQEKANNFYYLDNDSMIKADTYKTAIEIVKRGMQNEINI